MKKNDNTDQKGVTGWIDKRLPIFTFMNNNLRDYPTPKNLNYFWNFGSLAGITLVIMIVTGKALSRAVTWTGVGSIDKVFGLLFW